MKTFAATLLFAAIASAKKMPTAVDEVPVPPMEIEVVDDVMEHE